MKILVYGGGLGNQIFGYAFTEFLRSKYKDSRLYGVYNKRMMSEHYGLEINKWFDVNYCQNDDFANEDLEVFATERV